MTLEDKQLLLKDLCARLLYGVICNVQDGRINKDYVLTDIHANGYGFDNKYGVFYGSESFIVKPYLRPMSSMTEEEKEDLLITLLGKNDTKYFQILPDGSIDNTDAAHQDLSNFNIHWVNFDGVNTSTYIDWLNAHHFDFRNLIERGLAIDCTGLNVY